MKPLLSVLLFLGFGVEVLPAQVPPKRATARLQRAFPVQALDANRVSCLVDDGGRLCSDIGDFLSAGSWPRGTPDNYIFQSGLQFAGIIPVTAGGGKASFPWAGDTIGAYFADLRGTQGSGQALTQVFSSRDTADLRLWPNGAVTRDAALFDVHLLGRQAVSDKDLWVRYWDGNPRYLSGRTHPMGIVVDQRAMAFNSPRGNDDIVYFIFTLYNVTARDPGVYANAIDPALSADIAALGVRFQDSVEAQLSVSIPDGGYRIDSLYAGLVMDADVGDFSQNYSSVILPFDLGIAYQRDFVTPYWNFPLEIYGPPFVKATGLLGTRFVKSPAPSLAMFSNFTGSATGYPDPVGVLQLWRYLSGNSDPANGDGSCTFGAGQQARHYCFLLQVPTDTRYFQSTGPFSLDPGESKTLVLAYVFAAPTPAVVPYVGGDLKPGVPAPGDSIAVDSTRVRDLERAAGWVTQSDANGNGIIEANEVTTVPRSLLDKARVAQALVDHKFLLPQAPAAPPFFLIPGDNQVTVVWQKSATEAGGDPYFAIASDSTSPLFDRNFRQNDVEGYRIYRGRDPRSLQLVAQLEYGGVMMDYAGTFQYPGECAPELGILTDCPDFTNGVDHRASGAVQVPPGGRTLVNGSVFIVRSDTAVTGGNSGFPGYGGSVNFVYVDLGVRNSFSYVYAVTAFDVNSITSGPSSLESPRVVKGVTPRAPSGQEILGTLGSTQLIARGQVLDTTAPSPTLDRVTGIFSGPAAPTNGLTLLLTGFVPEVVTDSAATLTIDSIVPGNPAAGRPALYYVSVRGGAPTTLVVPINVDFFSSTASASVTFPAVNADPVQVTRFGGDSTFSLYGRAYLNVPGTWRLASWGRASVNADPPSSDQAGPRWWAGTPNENTTAPNELQCTPAFGNCVQPNLSRNAGRLPGVTTLFHLQSYSTVPNTPMRELEGIGATVARAADFRLYWGAGGHVDSVIDVTHGVAVPYAPGIGASWGFLTDSSFLLGGTNSATTADSTNALLTWSDALCVAPAPAYLNQCGGAAQAPARLQDHARLSPVAAQSSTYTGTAALTATGNGFIVYLNGHFFLMQLPSLPVAGTVWNARFFAGSITGTAAAGTYQFVPEYLRPPAVPGLEARISFTGSRLDPRFTSDSLVRLVHTVPDPYYVTDPLEIGPLDKALRFVHLPAQSIIRIYSTSGILVRALVHNDPTGGGEETWDLRSRTGRFVASGVYFFHVETPDGHHHVGRFTIVTFRPPGAR